jgi:CBS domain containing-hemolysin-like protein
MLRVILALFCGAATGYLVLLLRSFEYLTLAELKRQARNGNRQAKKVYSVRGPYGTHVFVFLWMLIGLLSSTMILLLESVFWSWVVIIVSLPITILVHAVLPWSKYPAPSLSMAAASSRVFVVLLRLIAPLLNVLEKLTGRWIGRTEIRRINSKEELLDVLEHTRIESDPFSKDELLIAVHALTFGDKKITEIMTPYSVVKTVRRDDVLSPVLLGELHDSGYSRFPVIEPEHGAVVGMLYSKDLVELHSNKTIGGVMRPELYYVNEFTALDNVLNAFLRTKHHLFLVVNEFEEIVGVVTIEDVIEQIIGRKIVDEFDRYDDLRAVAKQHALEKAEKRDGILVNG